MLYINTHYYYYYYYYYTCLLYPDVLVPLSDENHRSYRRKIKAIVCISEQGPLEEVGTSTCNVKKALRVQSY
jgi:hypothetical protein